MLTTTTLILLLLYILPAMNASSRGHRSFGAILALNVLLGWTALGWIAAFVWSCGPDTKRNAARNETALIKAIAAAIAADRSNR